MKEKDYPDWLTAEELRQKLESDPEWVTAAKKREEEHQEWVLRDIEAEQPIVQDLRNLGLDVDSFLSPDFEPTPEVFPVLFYHLNRFDNYTKSLRLAIALSFQSKHVKGHFSKLLQAFKDDPDLSEGGVKSYLGIAIEINYVDKYAKEVAALALDLSHGQARGWLVAALAKSKKPVAQEAYDKLKSDPEVAPWIEEIESKRKKKDEKAKKRRRDSLNKLRADLKETSISLDANTVPAVLKAVATKIEVGFGDAEVRKVAREVQAMDHNEESVLEFKVKPKWITRTLQILIHKSDIDVANLHFYAASSLIALIDKALEEIVPDLHVDV